MEKDSTLALRLAETGLSVFPVYNSVKTSKRKPLLMGWQTASTTDVATITMWWRKWPRALVAIDLAKAGLVVIDADRHEGGSDGVSALAKLMAEHGEDLSSVPATHTPGNGYHLYFRQPEGEPLRCRSGDLPAGIEVKGDGGNITAPGNQRLDGEYRANTTKHPDLIEAYKAGTIPRVPKWLVELIRPKVKVEAAPIIARQSGRRFEKYAAVALENEARKLAGMLRGERRNEALNLIAWKMGTMVARGWIERDEVERVLLQAARSCLLSESSAKATIASGLKGGLEHPHPDLPQSNRRRA